MIKGIDNKNGQLLIEGLTKALLNGKTAKQIFQEAQPKPTEQQIWTAFIKRCNK